MPTEVRQLDTSELNERVQRMYEEVALEPEREFHFETGRPLAERLGYPPGDLDRIPAAAIDSFAGVAHWAACIGGAMQRDGYRAAIETAGFAITEWRTNTAYLFVSERADNATQKKYGVTSISLLAVRP